jgi:hypothetical protein
MDITYVPDPNKADGRPVVTSSGSDGPIAYEALSIAQAGTVTANAAYGIAVIGTNTAEDAYALAVIGTNSEATAEAAYDLAVNGTNTADVAYALAINGTNTANGAYSIAVSGTNTANSAQSTANSAFNLAVIGTGASANATSAYNLAVTGTNSATTAQNRADAAYYVAQIGTNTGTNALTLATTGSNLAWSAYTLAVIGTNSAGTPLIPDWTAILRGAVVRGSNLKAFTKPAGGDANWNNNFASVEGYAGGVRCTFKINSTNSGGYFGLTANAATLASSSDSYFWNISSFGLAYIVGLVSVGSYVGTVDATTVLDITYDAGFVRYWVNGAVVFTVARATTAKLYLLGVLANAASDGYNCVDFEPSLTAVSYTLASAGSNLAWSIYQSTGTGATVTSASTNTFTNKTLVDAKFVTTINAQTGTAYTFALSDSSKLVTFNNGSAVSVYVPSYGSVAFPAGTQIDVMQIGAGKVTLAGTNGCTLNAKSGNKSLSAQYVAASIFSVGTDNWVLVGDLIA